MIVEELQFNPPPTHTRAEATLIPPGLKLKDLHMSRSVRSCSFHLRMSTLVPILSFDNQ